MEVRTAPRLLGIRPAFLPVGIARGAVVGHVRAALLLMGAAPRLLGGRPPCPPVGEPGVAVVGCLQFDQSRLLTSKLPTWRNGTSAKRELAMGNLVHPPKIGGGGGTKMSKQPATLAPSLDIGLRTNQFDQGSATKPSHKPANNRATKPILALITSNPPPLTPPPPPPNPPPTPRPAQVLPACGTQPLCTWSQHQDFFPEDQRSIQWEKPTCSRNGHSQLSCFCVV